MSFAIGLKDFIFEMITPKTSINFKKMRLLARFPTYRKKIRGKVTSDNEKINQNSLNYVILRKKTEVIVNELDVNGYSESIELSDSTVAQIIKFCDSSPFTPDRTIDKSVSINFEDKTSPSTSSIFSILNPHLSLEFLGVIVEDSQLIHIAEQYLGTKPILMNSQIWYTFPNKMNKTHHNFGFHYDIDDYKFLKFFFYLDEVTNENGPHVIIRATHNESSLFKFFNRRISNELAEKTYPEKIVYMEGKRGQALQKTLFATIKAVILKKDDSFFKFNLV